MYGRRRLKWLGFFALFIASLGISSCGVTQTASDLSTTVAEGILAPTEFVSATQDLQIELAEVRRGNMERNLELRVSLNFAVTRTLAFERYGGEYYAFHAGHVGARVQAGDILAQQSFEMTEAMEIAYYRLVFDIEQFESRYANGHRDYMQAIREARTALNNADSTQREAARLQLRRLELQLAQFEHDSEQTRQNYQQRLEYINRLTEQIYAPFDGILTFIRSTTPGSTVPHDTVFFTVADEDSFIFHSDSFVDILRFGDTVTIRGEYLSFEAIVVTDPLVAEERRTMRFSLLPTDSYAFREMLTSQGLSPFDLVDMGFVIEVNEILVHNTLIIPADAIRQEYLSEYVLIYNEGRVMKRYISRGFQFQSYVQVLMGVEEGQLVVIP